MMTHTLTFIGTATTLLRLGSFTVLTDPNFLHRGQRAYLGKGLWSRRLTDPAIDVDEVPGLDAVLLSHLHGDHFDRVARRGLSRAQPVHTVDGAPTLRVYVTGDTLTGDHVDEIARRHPEIDVAVVHLGGTRILLRTVTMDAPQGVDLVRRVRPGRVVPVHHDDYGVFRDPLSAFLQRATDAGLGDLVLDVPTGATFDLSPFLRAR